MNETKILSMIPKLLFCHMVTCHMVFMAWKRWEEQEPSSEHQKPINLWDHRLHNFSCGLLHMWSANCNVCDQLSMTSDVTAHICSNITPEATLYSTPLFKVSPTYLMSLQEGPNCLISTVDTTLLYTHQCHETKYLVYYGDALIDEYAK